MILINGWIIIWNLEDQNKSFTQVLRDGTRFIGAIDAQFLLIFHRQFFELLTSGRKSP